MKGQMRKKFTCQACGKSIGAPVIDTALIYSGYLRYRQCEKCNTVFVTVEKFVRISSGRKGRGNEQQTSSQGSSQEN